MISFNICLILVEDAGLVKDVINFTAQDRSNKKIIVALSVPVKVAFEKFGIECFFPEDLISLPDFNQIGTKNWKITTDLCDLFDEKLKEQIKFIKDHNMNVLSAAFFELKVLFDTLFVLESVIMALMNKIEPDKVAIFGVTNKTDSIYSLWGRFLLFFLKNIIGDDNERFIVVSKKNDFKNRLIPQKREIKYLLKNLKRFKVYEGNSRLKGLVLDDSHDVRYLTETLLKKFDFYSMNVFHFDNELCWGYPNFIKPIKKDIKILKKLNDELSEVFHIVENSDLYRNNLSNELIRNFMEEFFQEYFIRKMSHILLQAEQIKDGLIKLDPKVLISSYCRFGLENAFLLELARSLHVPVVVYQEGGGAGYLDWPLFNLDMKFSDYFLVYGQGVEKSSFLRGSSKIVPIGSMRLADYKKRINTRNFKNSNDTKMICVVLAGIKTSFWQHYPGNGHFYSVDYSLQVKLISLLRKFNKVKIIIKVSAGASGLYEHLIDKDFMEVSDKPLMEYLKKSDAFILDYPCTTMLECLMTNKPIAYLDYGVNYKMDPEAHKLLVRRIRYSSNEAEFCSVIETLIEDIASGSEMLKESEFIDEYCLMKDSKVRIEGFCNILSSGFSQKNCLGKV